MMGGVGSMGGEVCGVSYEARGVRTRRPGGQCTMQAHAHAHEGSRLGCAKHDAQELGGRAVWAKHTTAHRATLAQGRRWRRDVRAGQVEAGLDGRNTTVGEIERKGRWTSGSRWMKTGRAS